MIFKSYIFTKVLYLRSSIIIINNNNNIYFYIL